MDHNFSFRTDRYDFWPIYEAIRKYYPLGIDHRDDGIFYEYQGLKEVEKLLIDNIHESVNYEERWSNKIKKWGIELGFEITSTTYGQEPSFSAYVELENVKMKDRVIGKQLHFTVSLLGSFYTIFGTDYTTLIEKDAQLGDNQLDKYYENLHRTVISPYSEFSNLFIKLREIIESEFKDYRFIPYSIHSMVLNGLEVREESLNRIYHALFNQFFDFGSPIVGDKFDYGFDQWIVENPNFKNHWNVYPPQSFSDGSR